MRTLRCFVLALLLSPLAAVAADAPPRPWDALPDVSLDGQVVKTARHEITVAPSGLPAQILLKAAPSELPLEKRGGKVTDEDRTAAGRGFLLRAPVRIEATVDGAPTPAKVTTAAAPQVKDGSVVATSTLQIGPATATLSVAYGKDGSLTGELAYKGNLGAVEALDIVVDFAGMVDTAVAGSPTPEKIAVLPAASYRVPKDGEGVVWGNMDMPEGGRAVPGPVSFCFVGNGDRGISLLSDGKTGFHVDPKTSCVLVERSKDGEYTWRIRIVNRTGAKPATFPFALLVHPASFKPETRKARWLALGPGEATDAEASLPGREAAKAAGGVGFAGAAAVHEAMFTSILLDGTSGGDAVSAADDLADTWPLPLFRFLAGTHTGLRARLSPNCADITTAGANPAPDRMALGRALLLDIGLDALGLADRPDAARVVSALDEFGLLADDGKTEFVPWWRNGGMLRYGEEFAPEANAFETNAENPVAAVRVSLYRRPHGKTAKALFVIVNEGDAPVRQQFYILDCKRVFGGHNALRESVFVKDRYDFSDMPPRSDWSEGNVASRTSGDRRKGTDIILRDMENDGPVARATVEGNMEIYGPVFVPAHGFRLLAGYGR